MALKRSGWDSILSWVARSSYCIRATDSVAMAAMAEAAGIAAMGEVAADILEDLEGLELGSGDGSITFDTA
jgi:hypothetical protein